MAFEAFPDYHETIEDIIAEGDKVWILVKTNTGKHTGEFMGVTPTGKKLTTLAVDMLHVVNGKIVEYRDVVDRLDFLTQLGIIKYTEIGKRIFQKE
jgi:predicted ester cyclase